MNHCMNFKFSAQYHVALLKIGRDHRQTPTADDVSMEDEYLNPSSGYMSGGRSYWCAIHLSTYLMVSIYVLWAWILLYM